MNKHTILDLIWISDESSDRLGRIVSLYQQYLIFLNVLMEKNGLVDKEYYFKNRTDRKEYIILSSRMLKPMNNYFELDNFYKEESNVLVKKIDKYGKLSIKLMFFNFIRILILILIIVIASSPFWR